MTEKSVSTLGRIASVLGVASKNSKTTTPIESILRMQQFQIWGFILMILAIAAIIWLIQKKLDSIDKQYKEQFILLHRLFKSHQDLQVKVHKNNQQQPMSTNINNNNNNNNNNTPNVFVPVVPQPQITVVNLEPIKEEDNDTASVVTVETVETIGTVENDIVSDQKAVDVDDTLPDMFN
jgi:hypothetical protein